MWTEKYPSFFFERDRPQKAIGLFGYVVKEPFAAFTLYQIDFLPVDPNSLFFFLTPGNRPSFSPRKSIMNL